MYKAVNTALINQFPESGKPALTLGEGSPPHGQVALWWWGFAGCSAASSTSSRGCHRPPPPVMTTKMCPNITKYLLGNKATLSESLHHRQHCQSKAMVSNWSCDTPRESCGISRGNPLSLDLGMSVAAMPALMTLKCRNGSQRPWMYVWNSFL